MVGAGGTFDGIAGAAELHGTAHGQRTHPRRRRLGASWWLEKSIVHSCVVIDSRKFVHIGRSDQPDCAAIVIMIPIRKGLSVAYRRLGAHPKTWRRTPRRAIGRWGWAAPTSTWAGRCPRSASTRPAPRPESRRMVSVFIIDENE